MECKHSAGYHIIEGKLVCVLCGEPSPKVRLVEGEFIPIAQPEIEDKAVTHKETKAVVSSRS